jgi:hypothetical protein
VSETLEGMISYDLWDAYRRFSNPDIALIAETLYNSQGLTLGELRTRTRIENENVLNHGLMEMRRVWIVKKIGKKYHLTKYGAILFESISAIESRLSNNETKDDLFTPFGSRENSSSN